MANEYLQYLIAGGVVTLVVKIIFDWLKERGEGSVDRSKIVLKNECEACKHFFEMKIEMILRKIEKIEQRIEKLYERFLNLKDE